VLALRNEFAAEEDELQRRIAEAAARRYARPGIRAAIAATRRRQRGCAAARRETRASGASDEAVHTA
jgi:hypothetical protein